MIYVVEDDSSIRELIVYTLNIKEKSRYKSITYNNGNSKNK